jgi:hypothetical protein
MIKLIGQVIQSGDLLGAASSTAAASSGAMKGTSRDSFSSGERRGRQLRKVGKWAGLGDKGDTGVHWLGGGNRSSKAFIEMGAK